MQRDRQAARRRQGTGYLDPAAYERTVKILTENKVLTKEPKGAWTHKVYDASAKP